MSRGRRRAAPWEYELLKRRQVSIELYDLLFQCRHGCCIQLLSTRDGKLPSKLEQAMLCLVQAGLDRGGKIFRQEQSDHAVEFVDTADGLDTLIVFVDPGSIAQSCCAIVSGPGEDFGQSHVVKDGWQLCCIVNRLVLIKFPSL
jgi:hypothetical protein